MTKNQTMVRNTLVVACLVAVASVATITLEILGVINLAPGCTDDYRVQYRDNGGGTEMIPQTARTWVDRCNGSNPAINPYNNGCFISKQALDQIFCNDKNANGIVINLGKKDDGSLAYIVSPNQCIHGRISTISPSTNIFNSVTYCPPNCGNSPF